MKTGNELCDDCKRNEDWSSYRLQSFLENQGIKYFLITDGDTFTDEKRKLSFSMWNSFNCGKTITSMRKIDFDMDVFTVLYESSRTGIAFLDRNSEPEFKFVGKTPLVKQYNTAIIKKLCAFDEGAIDGSCYYEMWSVLLLQTDTRNKTTEELAEEERIRNLPSNPYDEGPPF